VGGGGGGGVVQVSAKHATGRARLKNRTRWSSSSRILINCWTTFRRVPGRASTEACHGKNVARCCAPSPTTSTARPSEAGRERLRIPLPGFRPCAAGARKPFAAARTTSRATAPAPTAITLYPAWPRRTQRQHQPDPLLRTPIDLHQRLYTPTSRTARPPPTSLCTIASSASYPIPFANAPTSVDHDGRPQGE